MTGMLKSVRLLSFGNFRVKGYLITLGDIQYILVARKISIDAVLVFFHAKIASIQEPAKAWATTASDFRVALPPPAYSTAGSFFAGPAIDAQNEVREIFRRFAKMLKYRFKVFGAKNVAKVPIRGWLKIMRSVCAAYMRFKIRFEALYRSKVVVYMDILRAKREALDEVPL